MRIPLSFCDAFVHEAAGFRLNAICEGKGTLDMVTYDNGEAIIRASSNKPGDYYFWHEKRQQRIEEFTTASEMWERVGEIIERGPDQYGLVQL
jgi:hypothetical protein